MRERAKVPGPLARLRHGGARGAALPQLRQITTPDHQVLRIGWAGYGHA